MTRAVSIPPRNALLCESCGYVLSGLPGEGRCPECGTAIASSLPNTRQPPAWVTLDASWPARWFATTRAALLGPRAFFRNLSTRRNRHKARQYRRINLWLLAVSTVAAALGHIAWATGAVQPHPTSVLIMLLTHLAAAVAASLVVTPLVGLVAGLVAWLTHIEANWRGHRLTNRTVDVALAYHTSHLLPPVVVINGVIWGNHLLLAAGLTDYVSSSEAYLYILSASIVAGAAWAFGTYWLAMKRVLWANA